MLLLPKWFVSNWKKISYCIFLASLKSQRSFSDSNICIVACTAIYLSHFVVKFLLLWLKFYCSVQTSRLEWTPGSSAFDAANRIVWCDWSKSKRIAKSTLECESLWCHGGFSSDELNLPGWVLETDVVQMRELNESSVLWCPNWLMF